MKWPMIVLEIQNIFLWKAFYRDSFKYFYKYIFLELNNIHHGL